MPTPADLPAELARQVVELYAEAERILVERTARALAKGLGSPDWVDKKLAQVREYRRQVEKVIAGLEAKVPDAVEAALLEAYKRGGLEAVAEATAAERNALAKYAAIEWEPMPNRPWVIREADGSVRHRFSTLEQARAFVDKHPEYEMVYELDVLSGLRATETLQREALTNLTATHQRILRTALDTYRSVVAEASSQVLLGTQTRREACQTALDRFAKKGVTGFIDKRGRAWDLASYTEMATRTATAHAAVQGHVDRLQDHGMDLVFVSDAPGECELCRPWEGKVLSSSGRDPKYPSLNEARAAGLFHPGCRHSVSAYFPGVSKLPKHTADPEGDRNRQKQRYLERQVRAAKRLEAAALDERAKRKAQARVRAYQAKLREHVEATGGKRLYYRESIGKTPPQPEPARGPRPKDHAPRMTTPRGPGQATTTSEAEAFARSLGIPEVNYGRTHLELANKVNEMLSTIKDQRGLLPKDKLRISSQVRGFGGEAGRRAPAAFIANVGAGTTEVAINPRATFWLDPEGTQRAAHAVGMVATDDPLGVLLHELGHQEHYFSDPDRYVQLHFTGGGYQPLVWLLGPQVSRYAADSPLEFVAETYSGLATGRSYTREVMDLYRALGGPQV